MQCVENCDDPDPKRHVLYEQPVWQTLQMFRTSYPSPLIIISDVDYSPQSEKCSVRPLRRFLLPLSPGLMLLPRVGARLSPNVIHRSLGALAFFVRSTAR
jgi:hypothetical protein